MTTKIIAPAIEIAVNAAMAEGGFRIQRTTAKVVAWRRDLARTHLIVYFGDHDLYGAAQEERWTVLHVDDDPGGKVRIRDQLNLFEVLQAAKDYERVATSGPLSGTPMPNTDQTGNA